MKEFSNKISRGYRLTPGTHGLIKSLEQITRSDAESVLSRSLLMYLNFVFAEPQKNNTTQESQEKEKQFN